MKYGITVEEYDALFHKQSGLCGICGEPPSPANTRSGVLHVDHDHETGAVRSLLCFLCNSLLGMAKDDMKRLEAAMSYLTRYKPDGRLEEC